MNAGSTLMLQALAIITLRPAAYGLYSLIYLVGAFATLVVLAMITDVSARRVASPDPPGDWLSYASAAVFLSVLGGLAALGLSLGVSQLRILAPAAFIAVTTQTYRVAERFHSVRTHDVYRTLRADATSLLAVPVGWFVLRPAEFSGLVLITWIWAISSAAQLLFARAPARFSLRLMRLWFSRNAKDIGTLSGDSMITSIGAIGTPFLLAPLIGLSKLGTYRSISNITGPITMLLSPLRPQLAKLKPSDYYEARFMVRLGAASLVLGVATAVALEIVTQADFLRVSTLASLRPYTIQAGVCISAALIASIYSVVARFSCARRTLLFGRGLQSGTAIAFPLIGIAFGLTGIINGYTAACVACAAIWVVLARRERLSDASTETVGEVALEDFTADGV